MPPSRRTRVLILASVLIVLAGVLVPGTLPFHPQRPSRTRTPRFRTIEAPSVPLGGAQISASDESFPRPDFFDPEPEVDLGPEMTGPGVALELPAPWLSRAGRLGAGEVPEARVHLRC